MTPSMDDALSPIKRALLEIRQLKERVATLEAAGREPIAIIGMGLRFPGGAIDASSFAELLWSGRDTVAAIPAERFAVDALYSDDPDAPGKLTTRYGAFLEHVDRFDAEFFGIAPREAETMDPQQRILLEVSWEALEQAGRSPRSLAGSRTGVYVGIANGDYGRALFEHRELIDAYFATGNAYSVAAGRLSYFLGLRGPAMAVDTACSSSLSALHLACQALRLGECDLALAGGVNLVLTPEHNINFSKARMMAPDGRCKTFDASADGYVRGEGCGLVVLRRLRDALADGDRVLAVVRGSAVNQDGRSGGLTAPNGPAQEAVIRAALAAAQLEPGDVSYIEAHGTGTSLGDPIEAGALGAVFASGRDTPLPVGSLKTNIGHTEAAAGIAAVIKAVLMLERGEIPPSLHFATPNPHIDWDAARLTVPTAVTALPHRGASPVIGVSSFGFSGTNVHVVLSGAPASSRADAEMARLDDRPLHVLALSARDDAALAEQIARVDAALASTRDDAADVCFTAAVGRAHFAHRVAAVGATIEALRAGLRRARPEAPRVGPARVAFLFTGQGAQSPGMGRAFYESSSTFRATLDRCEAVVRDVRGESLLEVMWPAADSTRIGETDWAQPATFALQCALASMWKGWGIEPAAVLGHSLGEYAAACVAGVFSLEDGMRLVAERGRLTHALPPGGAMAAIFAPADRVREMLRRCASDVGIAAYNGPEHVVVSGPTEGVERVVTEFEGVGVQVKRLRIPHAAHSRLIEPTLGPFGAVLRTIAFARSRYPLISNVTGALAEPDALARPDYWLEHMRQPVRFSDSVEALVAHGITHAIEIGPHPVLLGMAGECVPGSSIEWLPSMRRDRDAWSEALDALQRLYVSGADVDWTGFDAGHARRRVVLPTYPFQRRRFWMDVVGRPQREAETVETRWDDVLRVLGREQRRVPAGVDARAASARWQALDALALEEMLAVVASSGAFAGAGARASTDGVLAKLGAAPAHTRLVTRWLRRLADAGHLRRDGDVFVVDAPLHVRPTAERRAQLDTVLRDDPALLAYIQRCVALLADVVRGAVSPLETLFPGGALSLAAGLYGDTDAHRYINDLLGSAVHAIAPRRANGLRVLEIGGGTGSGTAAVLAYLPADAEYWFTDVSPVFLDHARERFGGDARVRYATLDLEGDPASQGFEPGSFDLVIASNTLHATRDVAASLALVRAVVAPGGAIAIAEATTPFAWLDMTIGVMAGWGVYADSLRVDGPLLSADAWCQAIAEAGFEGAAAFPKAGVTTDFGQHVIVAYAPSGAGRALATPVARDIAPGVAAAFATTSDLLVRLAAALPAERHDVMLEFVLEQVAAVLKLGAEHPPGANDRLMDLGFDSLMAVQLRNRIGQALGLARPLPATLLFDHPTAGAMTRHLLTVVEPISRPASDRGEAPAPTADVPVLGAAEVAQMSDADIERLLLERMNVVTPGDPSR